MALVRALMRGVFSTVTIVIISLVVFWHSRLDSDSNSVITNLNMGLGRARGTR